MASTEKTSYPKEKIRILFLENISDLAVKNFQQQGYSQVVEDYQGSYGRRTSKRNKGCTYIRHPFQNADHHQSTRGSQKITGNRVLLHRGKPGEFKSSH